MIFSTLISWFQFATFYFFLSPIIVLVNMCFTGAFIFPIVGITLEELVVRTNPNFLVTLQVLCTIGTQGMAAIISYASSYFFTSKNKQKALDFQMYCAIAYSALMLIHIITLYVQGKENKRESFILRRKCKVEAVKKQKNNTKNSDDNIWEENKQKNNNAATDYFVSDSTIN